MTPPILPALQAVDPSATPEMLPVTIATILKQMRFWRLLQSATTMVGAPRYRIRYRHPDEGHDHETRGCRSSYDPAANSVAYSVGVEFPVNGLAEERWRMAVAYENDTYHAWIWSKDGVLGHSEDLYYDNLLDAVVALYDEQIRARCGGFLPNS